MCVHWRVYGFCSRSDQTNIEFITWFSFSKKLIALEPAQCQASHLPTFEVKTNKQQNNFCGNCFVLSMSINDVLDRKFAISKLFSPPSLLLELPCAHVIPFTITVYQYQTNIWIELNLFYFRKLLPATQICVIQLFGFLQLFFCMWNWKHGNIVEKIYFRAWATNVSNVQYMYCCWATIDHN